MKPSEIRITREWLQARCTQQDEHLMWRLNIQGGGPRGYLNEVQFSVRMAAWTLYHGKPVPEGKTARPSCGNERCLGEECLELIAHGGYNRGQPRSIATRKKNADAVRALKGTPPEIVQAIKSSDKAAKDLVAELGVSMTAVYDIRNGRRWVDFGNPYSQLLER